MCGLTHRQAVPGLKGSGQVRAPCPEAFLPSRAFLDGIRNCRGLWVGGREAGKKTKFLLLLSFFFFVLPLITVFLWGCETRRKQTAISKQKISAPTNSLEKVPCCLPRFQDQTAGWNGWGAMASPACLWVLLAHALVPSPLPSSPSHMVKALPRRCPSPSPCIFAHQGL